MFDRIPASPCTQKTSFSHLAGNGEVQKDGIFFFIIIIFKQIVRYGLGWVF